MDPCHRPQSQFHGRVLVAGAESLISIRETEYAPHSVMVEKAHHDGSNDIVQTGAQAAARHDPAFQFGGIEIDLFSGTGLFKERRGLACLEILLDFLQVVVIKHVVIVIDEMHAGHGRGNPALAQSAYGKIRPTFRHDASPSDLNIWTALVQLHINKVNKTSCRHFQWVEEHRP